MSATEQRTGRARRVRTVLSRTASGVTVLAIAGAAAAAGTIGDAPEPVAVDPVLVEVQPPPTELVCPGPVRLPTEQDADASLAFDPAFDPAPSVSRARLAAVSVAPVPGGDGRPAAGGLRTLGESIDSATPFEAAGSGSDVSGVGQERDLDQATVLRAGGAGDRPAWVAGAVVVHTADGDLRGSAAASCQRPSTEAWLVGGGTRLGSSARLVLQNPGRTPATVEITLWGPNGAVEVTGAPQYLVPAGTERALLLEGVAAEQQRVVVKVTATGGQVTAYLQDGRLRGFVPDGVDYVVAGQAPGLRQVVPGVAVADGDDVSSEGGVPDGRGTVLRLLAPDEGTTAEVAFVGSEGIVELPGAQSVPLETGVVTDVPLGDLPPDVYTVVVTAEQPVVAGAMIVRRASGAGDVAPDELPAERAWVASASVGTEGPLAVPPGSGARLLVAVVPATGTDGSGSFDGSGVDDAAVPDPTGADVTIEVIGTDGSTLVEHEERVATGRVTLLNPADLVPGGDAGDVVGVVLRTDDPRVAWSAVLGSPSATTADFVSVLIPVPPAPDQPTVPVRVR